MTHWNYFLNGEEFGPVGFGELAELIATGRIDGTTLVRREWPADWQRADTVPGLFREARRWREASTAAMSPPEAPAHVTWDETAAEMDFEPLSAPAGATTPPAIPANSSVPPGPAAEPTKPGWAETVVAAMRVAADRNRSPARRSWRAKLARRLPAPGTLRPAIRFGAAVAGANLAAFALLDWSDRQALRFPARDPAAASQAFPLFGPCGDAAYMALLLHAALLAGVAVYFAARWLEAHADD